MRWLTLPITMAFLTGCAGDESCETWNGLQQDASLQTCAAAVEVENPRLGPVAFVTASGEAVTLAPPRPQDRTPDGLRLVGQPWGLTVSDVDGAVVERDSVGGVVGVAVSSDGARTALGLDDGRLLFRDGDTTVERRLEPEPVEIGGLAWPNTARRLAFSPDGTRLATGELSGRLTVWSVPDGAPLWSARPSDGTPNIAFSPDGRLLASGSTDKALRAWDVATGSLLHTWTHDRFVTDVTFAPDERHLAVWLSERYTPRTTSPTAGRLPVSSGGSTQLAVAVLWRLP